ncbi:hypothetical protein [Mesorhizobium sp.]|uniref:hypothetical protein n=1 Tax=Mesorhizobium sp. TaxID=1871066 RepID=UPI0025FD6DE6|nr:hypothetical protein [Mesorhizobium sp.]
MGRTLLVFSLMLSFAQAGAQEWQQFGIERFGFVFDVPPEFELLHRSKDGDGAAFQSPRRSPPRRLGHRRRRKRLPASGQETDQSGRKRRLEIHLSAADA